MATTGGVANRPTSSRRRPGVWADIALTLGLIALATLVLNAGLVWLLVHQVQFSGRTDMAEQLAASLATAMAQPGSSEDREAGYRSLLAQFKDHDLRLLELYVTDASLRPLAMVEGEVPAVLDAGLREALFGRRPHVDIQGRFTDRARVVVTYPIAPSGPAVAALRLAVPLEGGSLMENNLGFVVIYTLFTGFIIALCGYVLLRRRLVVPIGVLRAGTARIASGDFDHRLFVEAAAEIVDLTEDLNEMAASLGSYRARTEEQVHRLEAANAALARVQADLIRSAKLASVGRLAAGIAHEVGNPLAAVVGYVELLRNECEPGFSADLLGRISREVERIHVIIRELLDYARPDAGTSLRFEVAEVLRGAVDTVGYQPLFRQVAIEITSPPAPAWIEAEPEKLHQVFVNLLLNAGDAMQGVGTVHCSVVRKDNLVEVIIEDDGPGFSAEQTPQLFEPFFTTKHPGEGIGLGLATSLAIVERFKGTLKAENAPEGGARLMVLLPAVEPPDTVSPQVLLG